MPEEIAQPTPEQQEAPEREQIGIHDPGERLLGKGEVLADRRQSNADDRHVENDHQVAQAQHDQREPARACAHGSAGAGDRRLLVQNPANDRGRGIRRQEIRL
jgi:hypothetical protein